METEKLVAKIIPPSDYKHRNGFNNEPLIDKLSPPEKELVEIALVQRLSTDHDLFIVTTLAYLKSQKAIPLLYSLLGQTVDVMRRIIISSSIFEINGDEKMVDISIEAFKPITDKYQRITAFYCLKKLKNPLTDRIIEDFVNHSDYLLSYNAKRALGK